MPWCPVCKNEYREGFTVCADCKVELVDSLEECVDEEKIRYTFGKREAMEPLANFMKFGGLTYAEVLTDEEISDEENCYIEILQSEEKLARSLTSVFLKDIAKKAQEIQAMAESDGEASDEEQVSAEFFDTEMLNGSPDSDGGAETAETSGVYVKASERAANYKSSAFALLSCGLLGVVFLLLINLGVLNVNFSGSFRVIVTVVLGIMFAIFIFVGIKSLKESKILEDLSDEEDRTTDDIQNWFIRNHSSESIDEAIGVQGDDSIEEEVKYFSRCEYMKKEIVQEFGEMSSSYLDKNIEDLYSAIFDMSDR